MKRYLNLIVIGMFFIFSSCGNNRNVLIDGVDGPYLLIENKSLIITTIFDDIKIKEDAIYKIPNFDSAYIETKLNDNDQTTLTFKFDIRELLKFDDGQLPLINLPDKRNIPEVFGGSLPGIDFSIDKFEYTSMYISSNKLGFFIPFNKFKDFSSMATFDFYLNNLNAGTITFVGTEEDHHIPGIILILNFGRVVKDDLLAYLSGARI